MSDESRELVEGAARGDERAVDALLSRHLSDLRAYVRLRLGSALRAKESSSDIVQAVCLDVLREVGSVEYRGEASFRHWLFTRAEHKIVDRVRHYGRERRDVAREQPLAGRDDDAELLESYKTFCTPSREAVAREELERVEAAFRALPPQYREVILLGRVVGLSAGDIAERLGRTREAVWALQSRALARLSTLLERESAP